MKNFKITFLVLFISAMCFAQVGIGTATATPGAILELKAADKALLLTRVANTAAITTPVNGMLVYDISSNCVKGYQNGIWTGCFNNVGSTGSGTSFGGGALNCDTNWGVNPISAGTQALRAEGFSGREVGAVDQPIVLDATGKKFYNSTTNFFYDKDDVKAIYAAAGLTIPVNQPGYLFPMSSQNNQWNPNAHWTEMKIFGQLYPTKTWKQFSTYASNKTSGAGTGDHTTPDLWMMLLSTDGELKTVRYAGGIIPSFIYPGMSGREGVGKTLPLITTAMNPLDYFVTTDIKAYSNVNTPTATNWSWFEPYMSGYFSNAVAWPGNTEISAAIAYNAADNLFYTWGTQNVVGSQQTVYTAFPNILLRTTPADITASMTPLPATILNTLLATLGTTVKVPTNENNTIIISKMYEDARPTLNFIAGNNKIVRYNLDNNFYTSLTMPAGVNAVSIHRKGVTANAFDANTIVILGSDGKLYKTDSIATAAGQTGTITTYADPIFATATRKIMQYSDGEFIDTDGLLGFFNSTGASLNVILPKQIVPIKRLIFAGRNRTTNLFIDTNNNFGEYAKSWGSGPVYNSKGNVAGRVANHLYFTLSWVAPTLLESYQFYPDRCTTY